MPDETRERGVDLEPVVDELTTSAHVFDRLRGRLPCVYPLPSREALREIAENLRSALFPGYFGASDINASNIRYHLGWNLDATLRALEQQIQRGLCFACTEKEAVPECSRRGTGLARRFLEGLPEVQRRLGQDVEAAYEGDPACTTRDEAILAYPGVHALTYYRVAHLLHALDVPLLPRIITEIAHGATGIDVHPGAVIGERFFIDHGTGVVIGATAVIGDRVRLYQGVTLGAKSFPLDEHGHPIKGVPRHPIIEDDVIIYAGATILGRVTIGKGSVIGGNVWLTRSVPPGSRVMQVKARQESFEAGAGI
jgi:serine O-acetyltransferase